MGGRLALLLAAALLLPLAARAELISNSTLSETQCNGDEQEGTYCYVASSTFPRVCDCVRNVCPSASISETTNCFICDRGARRRRRRPSRRRRRQPPVCGGKRAAPRNSSRAACRPSHAAGYGVYASEEECMASEAFVEAVGIDPSSYPIPSFPSTSCPARSRATGSVSAGWACRMGAC